MAPEPQRPTPRQTAAAPARTTQGNAAAPGRAPQASAAQLRAAQARAAQSAQSAQPASTTARSAQGRSTAAQQARTAAARQAAAGRPAPGRDTDEFARLMQRNTVDVRDQPRGRKKRSPVVGKIALGLAVVSAAVDASAFAVFMGGDTDFAFGICFVVVFLTLIAAVLGFVAAVGSFGRWYGAVGVVVAFVANPVILIVLIVVVAPELLTGMGGAAGGS